MKSVKLSLSVFFLLIVNFVFTYKYALRVTDAALYIASGLFLFQGLIFFWGEKRFVLKNRVRLLSVLTGTIWIGLLTFSHFKIQPESLSVDRWSVITAFIDACLNGTYPYDARSHTGSLPGPMPFYFLLASPFYAIGELGLFSLLGYLLFIWWLGRNSEKISSGSFVLFFLLTSVFSYWEIAVRSNIFTNAALVLALMLCLERFDYRFSWKFVGLALLTGFFLSTRSVFVLVYLVWFIPVLIRKEVAFPRLLGFLSLAAAAFALTFLPLILAYPQDFLRMNPFVVQSTFLIPPGYTLAFMAMALVGGFLAKKSGDRYFYSGAVLFLSIAVYFVYHVVRIGFQKAYLDSFIDVSYFLFCVPFLLYFIMKNSIEASPQDR